MRTTAITAWALSTVLLALHNRGTAAAKPALRGLGAHAFPDEAAANEPGSACRAGVPPSVDQGLSYDFVFWEGIPRRYQLYMPKQAFAHPDRPLPLIVDFHGMPILEEMSEAIASGLDYRAEEGDGFIVARPHALGSFWNAGSCCFPYVDDVGFIRALVQRLQRLYCIDPRRVYAVGLSGGGMMIYKAACDAADVFAAVVSVGGARLAEPCNPVRPLPLLHFHGTDDWNVPYNGGPGAFGTVQLMPVEDTLRDWAVNKDGCTAGPTVTFRNHSATCRTWSACKGGAEVVLCSLEGVPHCWPGRGCPIWRTYPGYDDMDANDFMLAWFKKFTLPQPGDVVDGNRTSVVVGVGGV